MAIMLLIYTLFTRIKCNHPKLLHRVCLYGLSMSRTGVYEEIDIDIALLLYVDCRSIRIEIDRFSCCSNIFPF